MKFEYAMIYIPKGTYIQITFSVILPRNCYNYQHEPTCNLKTVGNSRSNCINNSTGEGATQNTSQRLIDGEDILKRRRSPISDCLYHLVGVSIDYQWLFIPGPGDSGGRRISSSASKGGG